jgi:hypothetical protein
MGTLATMLVLGVAPNAGGHAPARVASACYFRDRLPDARCTSGAGDPRVTQRSRDTTICRYRYRYTRSVRPPISVTRPIKVDREVAYGVQAPVAQTADEAMKRSKAEHAGVARSVACLRWAS